MFPDFRYTGDTMNTTITLPDREVALSTLEDALRGSPADQTEIVLLADSTDVTRYANSEIHQNVSQRDTRVAVRVAVGQGSARVFTNSLDVAATLFQAFRPLPAPAYWPDYAVWPEHGIPRAVFPDVDGLEGRATATAHPALVPETIVIDHGRPFKSQHINSVCQRMGISIQPARLRTASDKGILERFFLTLRQTMSAGGRATRRSNHMPAPRGQDEDR